MLMLSRAAAIALNMAAYVFGPFSRMTTRLPRTSGPSATACSSARWRARTSLLSAPPGLASISLLLSGDRMRPLAAWNWTLAGSTRARSGVITGNAPQPVSASAPTAQARCSHCHVDDRFNPVSEIRWHECAGQRSDAGECARDIRHQRRTFVDEARVDLHEVGAGLAFG